MPTESIRVLLVEDNLGDARLLYEGLEEALPGQFQMTHVRQLSERWSISGKSPATLFCSTLVCRTVTALIPLFWPGRSA